MSRTILYPSHASTTWVRTEIDSGVVCAILRPSQATRIIAAWYFLHQDDPSYPETNFNSNLPYDDATNQHVDVQEDHYKLVRTIGAASIVLLKNENNALPLVKPRTIAMIGQDASAGLYGPSPTQNYDTDTVRLGNVFWFFT